MVKSYQFREKIWLYPGKAGWYFLTLPGDVAKNISFYFSQPKRGWGSIPVKVRIGTTEWETSIFPDKKSGSYLLPIKAQVRKNEQLQEGSVVEVLLEVVGGF